MNDNERRKMEAAIVELKRRDPNFREGGLFNEPDTAHMLSVDATTLKRWRRAGLVDFVRWGEKGVRYSGWLIIDIHLNGTRKRWKGAERRQPNQLPYTGIERRKAS